MNRAKRGTRARQDGAAAVEFALVSTLLFLVMFGILQYGLYFNDSLNNRQGVREGARLGVVENFSPSGCATGTNAEKLACTVKAQMAPLTGTAYVRITTPSGWAKGNPLVVCGAVKETTNLGIVPMPNGGWIYSKTQMSIEQETLKTSWTAAGYTADNPSGVDWTACG